jgi:hypothetical protein
MSDTDSNSVFSSGHIRDERQSVFFDSDSKYVPRKKRRMDRKNLLRIFVTLPLVWSLILSGARADAKAPRKKDREMYRTIAFRIVDKLITAEGRDYPDLGKLSADTNGGQPSAFREQSHQRLWIAYHYIHGMSRLPNPEHKPEEKGGATVKSFADDGVELNLYFYEGDWMGQAAVSPLQIGQIKIAIFIEGSRAPRKAFGEALSRAIEQEHHAFRRITSSKD